MVFYPNGELDNDDTNWWGPNASAVEAMLRSVGFNDIVTFRGESQKPICKTRNLLRRLFRGRLRGTRMTFHARR